MQETDSFWRCIRLNCILWIFQWLISDVTKFPFFSFELSHKFLGVDTPLKELQSVLNITNSIFLFQYILIQKQFEQYLLYLKKKKIRTFLQFYIFYRGQPQLPMGTELCWAKVRHLTMMQIEVNEIVYHPYSIFIYILYCFLWNS